MNDITTSDQHLPKPSKLYELKLLLESIANDGDDVDIESIISMFDKFITHYERKTNE